MGLFTPRYPKSDTSGAASTPAKRESRADRKQREYLEAQQQRLDDRFAEHHQAMDERDTRRRNRFSR